MHALRCNVAAAVHAGLFNGMGACGASWAGGNTAFEHIGKMRLVVGVGLTRECACGVWVCVFACTCVGGYLREFVCRVGWHCGDCGGTRGADKSALLRQISVGRCT